MYIDQIWKWTIVSSVGGNRLMILILTQVNTIIWYVQFFVFGAHFWPISHTFKGINSWESCGRRPRFPLCLLFHDFVEFVQLVKQKRQVLPQQQKTTIVYSCPNQDIQNFHIYFCRRMLQGFFFSRLTNGMTHMDDYAMGYVLACILRFQVTKYKTSILWSEPDCTGNNLEKAILECVFYVVDLCWFLMRTMTGNRITAYCSLACIYII